MSVPILCTYMSLSSFSSRRSLWFTRQPSFVSGAGRKRWAGSSSGADGDRLAPKGYVMTCGRRNQSLLDLGLDRVDDGVELFVSIALTVSHRQFGMNKSVGHSDLKRPGTTSCLTGLNVDCVSKLVVEKRCQAVSKTLVGSPSSEVNAHGKST